MLATDDDRRHNRVPVISERTAVSDEVPSTDSSITHHCLACDQWVPVAETGTCPLCGTVVGESVPTGATTILYMPGANYPPLPQSELSTKPDSAIPPNPLATVVTQKAPRRRSIADSLSGKTLGVYRCEALLGRGAMGAVYLAVHGQLERRCALKVLSPKFIETDADYVSRFRQEAIAVANLHHPHVVMAYAVGEHDGLHFLEMEFVSGLSLQKVLDTRGVFEPAEALRVTAQVSDGLAAAHRAGLVHRDVKPENVLMTKESIGLGRAKIGDFGLAKRVRGRGEKVFDGLVGTPHYMAPELFTGGTASPSTDVYALGVCLYRMLTGRVPFEAKTVKQLITQINSQPFPDVRTHCPDLPEDITELLNWLVARNPKERAHDADEAQSRLFAVLGQVRDVKQLLTEAFANEPDVKWSAREAANEFEILVTLRNGRQQRVIIAPSDENVPFRQLQIFSIGGPAAADHFELALRRNAIQPHGSIAVRDIDGRPHFVVVENHSRAKVDAEELGRSVHHIARHADAVEEFLTGRDMN